MVELHKREHTQLRSSTQRQASSRTPGTRTWHPHRGPSPRQTRPTDAGGANRLRTLNTCITLAAGLTPPNRPAGPRPGSLQTACSCGPPRPARRGALLCQHGGFGRLLVKKKRDRMKRQARANANNKKKMTSVTEGATRAAHQIQGFASVWSASCSFLLRPPVALYPSSESASKSA
jgi:hypothetical protein